MNKPARAIIAATLILGLAGCGSMSSDAPTTSPNPAVPPVYVGLASGSLGQNLDIKDKATANAAEAAALARGERKTWRGQRGDYGYIEPASGGGDCRSFTHTIYFNGRPRVGTGSSCKQNDGSWKLS